MSRLVKYLAVMGAALLSLGTVGISAPAPAQALEFNICQARSTLDTSGTTVKASGKGTCEAFAGRSSTVGTTVTLYLNGSVVKSSYNSCEFKTAAGLQTCTGVRVASTQRPSAGNWCAKVQLNYKDGTGANAVAVSKTGYGCR